ncbi:hypothetical protein BCR44DRAFT_1440175 [Catenaria anguillulae PL171]|uniref:Uncharacterized protein n=1 Tax=Catenaria anguillulae PL171 TaxID=765915 RepID=A0A1Y2HD34_9FUNG|nr:hypothetical protein BCR44DRAFT_1440175 [Catenaria anguillulae PL171]
MNDPLSDRQAAYGPTGAAAPSAAAAPESHFLAVKLLRLSRPALALGAPQLSFLSVPVQSSATSIDTDSTAEPTPTLAPSDATFLTLPTSFGNIYLGESLDFSLHINHDGLPQSDPPAYQVAVKVELQTTNTRASLLDTLAPHIQLGASASWPVHHDVRELGMHILVVQVSYNSGKYLRKFYKFNALNPFQVKTKTTPMPHGRVLLELAVQNLAQAPVALTRAALVPNAAAYQCRDVLPTRDPTMAAAEDNGDSVTYLMPMDIRQFLFLFTSRASSSSPLSPSPSTSSTSSLPPLGRLELEWDGAASAGRLQTPPLPRKPGQGDGDLEVAAVAAPSCVPVGQPFAITLGITNNTRMTASLSAVFLDNQTAAPASAAQATPVGAIPTRPPMPTSSAPALSFTRQNPSPIKSTISLASVNAVGGAGGRASPSISPPGSPARRSASGTGHRRAGSLTAFRQSVGASTASPSGSAGISPSPSYMASPPDAAAPGPGAPIALSLLHQVQLPAIARAADAVRANKLLVMGASMVSVPDVPAGATVNVTVRVVGVVSGVLGLPRVRLVDALTGVAREVDARVGVWVGGVGPPRGEAASGRVMA